MHSSVNNHDTSTSILSIKEIIGIVIVFGLVLYLLFPKDNIKQIIERRGENTDLSINYLESMLLYYPDNIKLEMILLKNYDYAGEREKAFLLIDKILSQTEEREVRKKLYKTQYLLTKEIYFESEEKSILVDIRDQLYHYFEYTRDELDYMFFLAEATQMDFQELKYISLKGLMKQQPELVDYGLEREAFYLSSAFGDREESYQYLLHLLEYPEVERVLKVNALTALLEHRAYKKASTVATDLFLDSKEIEEVRSYFNIALYATIQNKKSDKDGTKRLIELYQNSRDLQTYDIYIILDSLLKFGDSKGASDFAMYSFEIYKEVFDEEAIALAIKSLVYHQKLDMALEMARFAYDKFHKSRWLDHAIQLSIWTGKMEETVALNIKGYRDLGEMKYEKYILDSTTLDSAYKVLGEIYKKRGMIEEIAQYYEYSGEIGEAESYFLKRLSQTKNQKIHRQAIIFAYKNSHFKQGLRLYEQYKKRYGLDKVLHQLSIKKLLALKEFKKAYSFSKELKKEQMDRQTLTDLSWIYKDYNYLYRTLWSFEQSDILPNGGYEKLIHLEEAINQNKNIAHLYQKAWNKSANQSYLFALLYRYLEDKNLKGFWQVIEGLDSKSKKRLTKITHYHMLLANYYAQTSQMNRAIKAFKKALHLDRYSVNTHQAYLWFLLDNGLDAPLKEEMTLLREHPKLQRQVGLSSVVGAFRFQHNDLALRWLKALPQKHKEAIPFRDRVVASLDIGDRDGAYSLAFRGLEKNSRDTDLYTIYNEMLNRDYPKAELKTDYRQISSNLLATENQVSYRWNLYKGLQSKLSWNQRQYQRDKGKNFSDNSLSLSLKNSDKKLEWDFGLAQHNTTDDFISASLNLKYRLYKMDLSLISKYQNKTKQTSKLEVEGMESSVEFKAKKALSQRVQLGITYKQSRYKKQDHTKVGDSSHMQLYADYLLRAGYPDMRFNTYLSRNQYDNTKYNMLPKDFWEWGTQFSMGATGYQNMQQSWKPFGMLGMAINSHQDIGGRLSMGVSSRLSREDSLSLSFDYTKGVEMISEPSYGVHLNYRF